MEALVEFGDQIAEAETEDRIFRIRIAREIREAVKHWPLPDPYVEVPRDWAALIDWGRPK